MQLQPINFTGKFQKPELTKNQKIGVAVGAAATVAATATVAGLAIKGKKINKNAKLGEAIKLGWNALKKATSKKYDAAKEAVKGWFDKNKKKTVVHQYTTNGTNVVIGNEAVTISNKGKGKAKPNKAK